LIFVIGEGVVRRLGTGDVQISDAVAAAGPTIREKVTVTDADLQRGLLTYRRTNERLEGVKLEGTMRGVANVTSDANSTPFIEAVTAYFNSITPVGIIVHHSSTLTNTRSIPKDVQEVDLFHSQKGFNILCEGRRYHVAYHYLVLANGKVEAGRPERCEGAHSEGYNSYLGISVAGDFSSKGNPRAQRGPTKQQFASLVALSRKLMSRYHIPLNRILRHSDVARTECPGDRFPFREFLAELQ
jgi:hypothetical protein